MPYIPKSGLVIGNVATGNATANSIVALDAAKASRTGNYLFYNGILFSVRNNTVANFGFDVALTSITTPPNAGVPWMRPAGGSLDYWFINAGSNTAWVAACWDTGLGFIIGDGLGIKQTYLSVPVAGTLKVTTNGATLGTVQCSTIDASGNVLLAKTITAPGTTAPQTIQKSTGRINFAAADTSKVVTNALVTVNSIIICTVATNDSTMKSVQAVAGNGTFTMYANAAATTETAVNFLVTN